eukprot:gnl/Dysnectes_brevis/8621_a15458_253.p1 GENE.gnl/Dysnectes_brevis/8621_a15458_253~~gnl/Dysnectes_brevis/8621_a15458_253.p1  ORF type:complete len:390 (+),score=70.75 gnl/Dysnectes_brevis/8621_a15458_253:48-1172(+)
MTCFRLIIDCMNPVFTSAASISAVSSFVTISEDGVTNLRQELLNALQKGEMSLSNWHDHPMNPNESNEHTLKWIFVIDTLNFCFWLPDSTAYICKWRGQEQKGYWGLCAAIHRAEERGIPILDPSFYGDPSRMSYQVFRSIFRNEDTAHQLPQLMAERYNALLEAGRVLLERWGGSVLSMVQSASQSALGLAGILSDNFSSYRDRMTIPEAVLARPPSTMDTAMLPISVDEHSGDSTTLFFHKRAQIFVAEVWACFGGTGIGEFKDIDTISIFADYRLPQMLAQVGVLRYSPALQMVLGDPSHRIPAGSWLEAEIRGVAIHAAERVRAGTGLTAVQLDFYLWDAAKRAQRAAGGNDAHMGGLQVPMHQTETIYY